LNAVKQNSSRKRGLSHSKRMQPIYKKEKEKENLEKRKKKMREKKKSSKEKKLKTETKKKMQKNWSAKKTK